MLKIGFLKIMESNLSKVCKQCNIEKLISEYDKHSCCKLGVHSRCKLCLRENQRIRLKSRTSEEIKLHNKKIAKYRTENSDIYYAYQKKFRTKIKKLVMINYGGDPPKCSCCGEDKKGFLTIDHINGGGRVHKKEIGGNLYGWLKINNYPEGFRVLCMNCNFAIGAYGSCPHKDPDVGEF